MNDYPDPYATGKYIAADDLSLWVKTTDQSYEHHRNDWMVTWMIFQRHDGLWYWKLVDHDGWDGERLYDEVMVVSEVGLPTWQDVARLLQSTKKL